jgi:hypothetical protein
VLVLLVRREIRFCTKERENQAQFKVFVCRGYCWVSGLVFTPHCRMDGER